jgi:hypothetical protein
MPGLLRGVARTAVVAGTATAVSNRVSRRQANRWAAENEQQQPQYQHYEDQPYQQPQQQYAAPAPSGPTMSDKLAQLKELGSLKEQGVLSDAEFEVQKAAILNA